MELGERPDISHVLIFENKGEAVGVSNPHPHCQIYANNFIFKTIETEARVSTRHLAETGRVLFQEIIAAEKQDKRRIIVENDSAIAFIPYFARYAYEVYVAPKETHPNLTTLSEREVRDFAEVLKTVVVNSTIFGRCRSLRHAFAPGSTDGHDYSGFHFHIEFHPPLRNQTC